MTLKILNLNYDVISKEITRRQFKGLDSKYCVMNEDTLNLFISQATTDYNSGCQERNSPVIFGLKVALSDHLNFGEVDIVG